jgi:hypothetical protein
MVNYQAMTTIPLPPLSEDSATRILVECYQGFGEWREDAWPRKLRLVEQGTDPLAHFNRIVEQQRRYHAA